MLVFGTCPEALKSGTVLLVGTNQDLIVSEVSTLLDDAQACERMSKAVNPTATARPAAASSWR